LYCSGTAILVIVGTKLSPPALFGEACAALVTLALGFCGANTWAGIKGLPGKSTHDSKDGTKSEE